MMYTYVHGGDVYTASGKKNLADAIYIPPAAKKTLLIILQTLIRLACRSL